MSATWKEALRFRVDGLPRAQPRPRVRRGGAGTYNPRKHVGPWKDAVAARARKGWHFPCYSGPLKVDIVFIMRRPARFGERTLRAYGVSNSKMPKGRVVHPVKPDRDNLDKAVLDALDSAGIFTDDSQVCSGTVEKFYAAEDEAPGAEIVMSRFLWRTNG